MKDLDSTTRESLGRLGALIRKQQRAVEDAEAAASDTTAEDLKREADRRSEVTYPKLERALGILDAAKKERGVRLYSDQKTKDSVQVILDLLDSRSEKRDDAA